MKRRLALCALALLGLAACQPDKPNFKLIDVTGANYARDFTLTDMNGQTRALSSLKGKLTVVFFGYTQCPDVCPTTLSEIVQIKQALGADGEKIQAVFVTVDPARDTPEVLRAYMGNFDPSFIAFVPTPEELERVAREFKIFYRKAEGKTPTSYTMEHTAGAYVYDMQGQLRLYTRYGAGPEPLLHDVRLLLKATPR